jgi:hypothetical protein
MRGLFFVPGFGKPHVWERIRPCATARRFIADDHGAPPNKPWRAPLLLNTAASSYKPPGGGGRNPVIKALASAKNWSSKSAETCVSATRAAVSITDNC